MRTDDLRRGAKVLGKTHPLCLTLLSSWGIVNFTFPFVILLAPRDSIILGQMTLREVLCVNAMEGLEKTVLNSTDGDGVVSGRPSKADRRPWMVSRN